MYPTTLLLILEYYRARLPVEIVKHIIRMSRPVLAIKDELLGDKSGEKRWSPEGNLIVCIYGGITGRLFSMERAIQIAVLEMELPCHPMDDSSFNPDPDSLITIEEAIANPQVIRCTRVCQMTHEQRHSQVACDLKALTIEYMRRLVETPYYVHMGNLINFDGEWIKCNRKIHQ